MVPATGNKYLDFVIEHYADIRALNEIYQEAEGKLPEWTARKVADAIVELSQTFFSVRGLVVEDEKEEVSWWDNDKYEYDERTDTGSGPYFSFESWTIDWDSLTADQLDKGASFTLFLDTSAIAKRGVRAYTDGWVEHFQKHRKALQKHRIRIVDTSYEDADDGGLYVLRYYLGDIVNIDCLRQPEVMQKNVQKAVKEFTDAVLPIMRRFGQQKKDMNHPAKKRRK